MSQPRQTAQDRMEIIVARAIELGYVPDGETVREEIRTYSGYSPRLLVSGGRLRFSLPDSGERVTVGPRTVCLYRRDAENKETFRRTTPTGFVREYSGDGVADMVCIATRHYDDVLDALAARVERQRAAAPTALAE